MATSFAAYASQYLNRQPDNHHHGQSTMSSSSQPIEANEVPPEVLPTHDDDEDPYLRLDEDEHVGRAGFRPGQQRTQTQQAIPLIARSPSPDSPPGWLAHLAHSPRRSSSPAPSSSTSDSSPPADLLTRPQTTAHAPLPPPPPPLEPHSLSLTDSLLPRDGLTRPLDVFTLPDPRHTPRKRRKHHDAAWISLWLGLVTLCTFFSIFLLFTTRRPAKFPSSMLPYTVLLRTVPMLVILTFVSAATAYVHVYLLRVFVKPVMVATSVFVPATLFISAIWAFVGSFMWDGDTVPTWGETVGLRLFALIPLALSVITARRLLHLPRQIHTTSSTLTLTTHLLIANPFLLALSPAILLLMLLGSLPFVTVVFRLLLIGYPTGGGQGQTALEWHVKAWANWAIALVLGVWLWTWAVARGVLRTTCASVIGAWYFADPSAPLPPPTSTHTIHAALTRSTGPSLGSIVLASLILTLLRVLHFSPSSCSACPHCSLGYPGSERVSRYALVYAGLTGVGFWECARRGRVLVSGIEEVVGRRFTSEPPLALLTISPLTLTFPFALMTYLFVAHTLGAPNEALGAALLAGGVTALVGLFCVGLVKDTADTLYMCYCIDKAAGERRREEVFIAFEYDGSSNTDDARRPSGSPQHQHKPAAGGTRALGLGKVGFGFAAPGHRRSTSGGGSAASTGGRERMMTSTQELNMKSQFLMNMRFGDRRGLGWVAVGLGMASSTRTGEEERESASEGEESQLGPGSDFFK
ncbi:plasma-membrane choline transporter-domain-containing protein [Flammula alnicola]|nr:plasma-membrane choline transporter-domain-containing protein [Flammula alnicola]